MTHETAKNLPQMIDAETSLDSIMSTGRSISLNHSLVSVEPGDPDIAAIFEVLRPMVERSTCSTPGSKILIDRGVTYRFRYSDSAGNSLQEIVVDKVRCAKRRKRDLIENPEGLPAT